MRHPALLKIGNLDTSMLPDVRSVVRRALGEVKPPAPSATNDMLVCDDDRYVALPIIQGAETEAGAGCLTVRHLALAPNRGVRELFRRGKWRRHYLAV